MKVKLKSILKTSFHQFDCYGEQQIIFRSGNVLCIKQIGKNQSSFIYLNKNMTQLYSFKPCTHKHGVFTAQKSEVGIQVALYSEKGQRKSVNLSQQSPFFSQIQKVDLLVDEYDNSLVYGSVKGKEASCIFLCDFSKGKVIALGFVPFFEDIKVDSTQNMTLSICGHNGNHNYRKSLRYSMNQWQIEEFLFKKIQPQHGTVIFHQLLSGCRFLMITKNAMYVFEDGQILQIIDLQQQVKVKLLLKIPHGILMVLQNQKINLYVQDQDEVTFYLKGQIKIDLDQDQKIYKMFLSFNNEEIVLRTNKNNLFIWKSQNIALQTGHFDLSFNKVQFSCTGQKDGSISIATGKKYCMLAGTKDVTIWNVEKNQFVISSQLIALNDNKRRMILAGAINPDGNSFIVSYQQKIIIYKILLTKFKYFSQFPIKRCQSIVYSHGGQLVACKFGKGSNSSVVIINMTRMVQLSILKIQSQPNQIIWNELDDELIISTETNYIQVYKIADSVRSHHIKFNQSINYIRKDYKTKKLFVSCQNKFYIVQNGNIIQMIQPHISNFHYIFPLYDHYFIVTKNGELHWSPSFKFDVQSYSYPLFTQKSFNLACRNSHLIAYSSFQNIMILKCPRDEKMIKKASEQDIIMMQRQQINNLFDKIKKIQSDFDMVQTSTQLKLQQQKNNYENALNLFKNQYKRQISFINSKFSEISMQKLKQQRQTQSVFDNIEAGQVKSLNQLQKMYQRKIVMQREKYLNLQQTSLQQKMTYQKIILNLQKKYHKDVQTIRENYQNEIQTERIKFQKLKSGHLNTKQAMQLKLYDLQQQNELALNNIQVNKDQIIKHLQIQFILMQQKHKNTLISCQTLQKTINDLNYSNQQKLNQYNSIKLKLEQSLNRKKQYQNQIVLKDKMLSQKNQIIQEYQHQIAGLQKAKYVLNFRTTQIRKQLEPKQALVDKLKSQLFKIDQQYKNQKKNNFQLTQKIEKLQKMHEFIKKQNTDIKSILKHKERIHDELCSEIFMIVNTIDPKDWNPSFIQIYQSYIKEQKFKSRQAKKKDDTSEEINRHLIHVQQSLLQVSTGNDKILKGKEKDVVRKMKENSQLVYELNVMRKKQKEYLKQKNEMSVAYEKLKRQINDQGKTSNNNSTRAHTANTGKTRRIISRDGFSREKSNFAEFNEFDNFKDKRRQKSRISSAHKTLMFKDEKRQRNNKFFEIAKQLQTARNTIKVQDQMIEELNHRLFGADQK